MKYKYYSFYDDVARLEEGKTIFEDKEFYRDGQWIKNEKRDRDLTDAMMGYGDYSTADYDEITEEAAMKLIKEKK